MRTSLAKENESPTSKGAGQWRAAARDKLTGEIRITASGSLSGASVLACVSKPEAMAARIAELEAALRDLENIATAVAMLPADARAIVCDDASLTRACAIIFSTAFGFPPTPTWNLSFSRKFDSA